MGHWKHVRLEEQELAERLCVACQDRMPTLRCPRCDGPTICGFCHERGHSRSCDYCEHVSDNVRDE